MEGIGKDEEKSLVDAFISVTSASRDEALFFLESHNFQLESAIHSFYENSNQDFRHQELEEEENTAVPQSSVPSPAPPPLISPAPATMSSRENEKKKASRPSGRRGGIRTLADLNRSSELGPDSGSDEPQEYYTGGEKR